MTFIGSLLGWTWALVAPLVVLYLVVSLVIIVVYNSDATTALTPKLKKDEPFFEDGSVVWITGAGSGLGEQLALQLAGHHTNNRSSIKLILSSRKAEHLEKVAAACRSKCPSNSNFEVKILPLDLSDLDSIPSKVEQAKALFNHGKKTKKIDVLINGAGVTTRSYISDSNFALDHYVTKVNYLGPICLIKQLGPDDFPTTIIQLGSIASKLGAPVRSSYSGSKFALHGWLEAFGVESIMQGRDLYVLNCILGSINTGLGSRALTNVEKNGGKIVTLQEDDSNIAQGLNPEWVAERILAVARQKKIFETWMAKPVELVAILYFVTYFRHTAFFIISRTIGRKYAVTKKQDDDKTTKAD